jgi:hypothetical protein
VLIAFSATLGAMTAHADGVRGERAIFDKPPTKAR